MVMVHYGFFIPASTILSQQTKIEKLRFFCMLLRGKSTVPHLTVIYQHLKVHLSKTEYQGLGGLMCDLAKLGKTW